METKRDIRTLINNIAVIGACVSIILGIFTSDDLEAIRRFVLGFGVLWYVKFFREGD